MKALINGLIRWITVVIMGLVTFFPEWGLLWLGIDLFPTYPLPVLVFGCLWAIPMALVLPLSLKTFQTVSSALIVLICGYGVYEGYNNQFMPIDVSNWWMFAVAIFFVVIGWIMVSTPLWRWGRGVIAVQGLDDGIDG